MSDAQLIRAYLGPNTIVDLELKKVVVLEEGSLRELDYEKTLIAAKTHLKKQIWKCNPESLPDRMKQARPEGPA